MVAMPKFNMYQALHTTVIGPEGRPLEIQIRTAQMHETAEYGVAAHWIYKEDGKGPVEDKVEWLKHLLDWQHDTQDPQEFKETLKADLFEDEVFVFTPKGEVKNLSAGSTPLDFAYAVHTDVGHSCVGAKVNGSIVPLHYQLRSGDIVEVLTAKQKRGPSLDSLKLVRTSRARNKIRAWFKEERREDAERNGREKLDEALRTRGIPMQKVSGSPLLADVIREMGFRKATEFYIALGQNKISAKTAANKLMQRLKAGEGGEEEEVAGAQTGEVRRTARLDVRQPQPAPAADARGEVRRQPGVDGAQVLGAGQPVGHRAQLVLGTRGCTLGLVSARPRPRDAPVTSTRVPAPTCIEAPS